jgi:surface protein
MDYLFYNKSTFNSNISNWNVSNVTTMAGMFYQAAAFNQPIGSWNVSQVTSFDVMFENAPNFDQDIRGWSVGSTAVLSNMFGFSTKMLLRSGDLATPVYSWFNQAAAPTGPVLMPCAFVLPQLNASYELSQALSIIGDYTAPAPYALPTITLSMPAWLFNDGLFQLQLTDSNINTLANPATEAVYFSEKITYYADPEKLPLLKDYANVLLKDLPVINGAALKPLRQRVTGVDGLGASMIHELAYQLIGVSLMDDQIDNGAALKASIDEYLTTSLPSFVRLQLANCNGKTQNIAGASDLTTRANVSRELFMQIVESVVGGVNPVTGTAKSSRLNSLFDGSNLVGGKYGIKFIAGDTLRFSITIAPYSVGGVVQDVDHIVDGAQHVKQEARTVELVITMVSSN